MTFKRCAGNSATDFVIGTIACKSNVYRCNDFHID